MELGHWCLPCVVSQPASLINSCCHMMDLLLLKDSWNPTCRCCLSSEAVPFLNQVMGFPDSSVDKESTCNAGDPSSIPGLGRSTGEGIGYPLQYSQASLVAQLVKNPPAMQETSVQSLHWEDPLEKGKATHSSILAWRILWTV